MGRTSTFGTHLNKAYLWPRGDSRGGRRRDRSPQPAGGGPAERRAGRRRIGGTPYNQYGREGVTIVRVVPFVRFSPQNRSPPDTPSARHPAPEAIPPHQRRPRVTHNSHPSGPRSATPGSAYPSARLVRILLVGSPTQGRINGSIPTTGVREGIMWVGAPICSAFVLPIHNCDGDLRCRFSH